MGLMIDREKIDKMSLTELIELNNLDWYWYQSIGFTPDEYRYLRDELDEKIKDKLIFILTYQIK